MRVASIRLGNLGGRAFLVLFLLSRLAGELFLAPQLMIICFCHEPLYLLMGRLVRVFARGGKI